MSENLEQIIVEILNKQVSPFLIYLFGSTATGNLHKDSDVDVAFQSNDKILDKYELFMIAQEIASKLNRDVDLIDLRLASTVFQAQVVHTGKVIYCSDHLKKAEYELKTLKMYTKLNEERSHILKNVEESGSIYEK
ncbi:nucleotidyltransferase domain-containing protein [Bacillus sp. BRMEA1]|uniref:type VII toxin-antitoxin system MntA family adenylyltransferase antitoxin n=1 Tax=Neobacillus endophyticus TaxID=2738405 RepID=UPI001563AE9F|nr:nucleotidyltransferase domain-containing protein [Neobacillus endophyticus]NRD81006.1 nucleotidyltransferase domain-containing protein [Neobacillus endophyticus]